MKDVEPREEITKALFRQRPSLSQLRRANYEPAIVTFIDLLGFREYIERLPARQVAQALRLFHVTGKDLYGAERTRVHAFSDSIVRIRIIPKQKKEARWDIEPSPLAMEIVHLARIQFELACWHGLFLRGGITFGNIYTRRGMVFGPALVRAYSIESKYAVYPRILVDPDILESLRTSSVLFARLSDRAKRLYAGGEECPDLDYTAMTLSDALIIDENGSVFIDYINMLIKGADLSFLAAHRAAIVHAFTEAQNVRVKAKYAWLAHYHNFTIRTDINFQEIGLTDENLGEFSISDPTILSVVSPSFSRLRRFDEAAVGRVRPLLDV